jgi:hypothetical protein
MAPTTMNETPMTDPEALMERALIDEFLHAHGASLSTLAALPLDKADALLKEASRYASLKLMEVESRARFVDSIEGDVDLSS